MNSNIISKYFMDKKFEEHLKKLEDPNYWEEVNFDLPENPTPEQKTKYEICKQILHYQMINKLTDKEIADMVGLSEGKVKHVLYCHVDEFTLDQLEHCISRLPNI